MFVGIIATAFLADDNGVGDLTFDLVVIAEQADFADVDGALAVLRLRHRLRRQGADLPAAHVAARRPHPGADGGLGDPRRRDAEARHLRPAALRAVPVPGGGVVGAAAVPHPRRHRHHLRGDRGDDADATSSGSSPTRRSPTSASSCSARSPSPASRCRAACCRWSTTGCRPGALFLLVGWIYERRHTRQIAELRGIQTVAPIFAAGFMVVMLSSIGVPGLNGFIGEYLILIGSFLTSRWWTVVATAGVILAARVPAVGVPAGVPRRGRRRQPRRSPRSASARARCSAC